MRVVIRVTSEDAACENGTPEKAQKREHRCRRVHHLRERCEAVQAVKRTSIFTTVELSVRARTVGCGTIYIGGEHRTPITAVPLNVATDTLNV